MGQKKHNTSNKHHEAARPEDGNKQRTNTKQPTEAAEQRRKKSIGLGVLGFLIEANKRRTAEGGDYRQKAGWRFRRPLKEDPIAREEDSRGYERQRVAERRGDAIERYRGKKEKEGRGEEGRGEKGGGD